MNENTPTASQTIEPMQPISLPLEETLSTEKHAEPKPSLLKRIWVLLAVAAVSIVTDQITKSLIRANIGLYDNASIAPFLDPYLSFTHTKNTGAAFSLMPNGGIIFFIIGIVVTSLILYYAPRLPVKDWLSRVALGMQFGGAVGNLIDRAHLGYVTDFLHFQIPQIGFDFPVFNVADSCIVVGVILLIAISFLRGEG